MSVILWWQLREQRTMTAGAALQVLRHLRRRHEEPGKQRTVDKSGVVAPSPRLEKNDCDCVIGIGDDGHEAQHMTVHTVAMPVEDAPEPFASAEPSLRPIVAIVTG